MDPNLKTVFDFVTQAEPDATLPICDAIFVFGTSNGDVARHAALLYNQKKAYRIVISGKYGGANNDGPSGFNSEAEYFASIMEREGVPREHMILESKATNTYENVILGMEACERAGFHPKTLILVAVPYLLRRARATFAKNFPKIKIYGSAMSVGEDFFTPYRLMRIKGELPRLVKYAEGGTIALTAIPEEVIKAAEQF